ncbi:hypothetical protein [Promicromonospora umidemergens]|uniref:Uncharacterized protein n=1 Tax=Promicromonospora umidemergens TaxID=629679 RepID=A0ABP8XYM3_9MICO|nr:hypothetical protein [Promicromonospora umidemergens]
MAELVAGDPDRSTNDGGRPSPAVLALRPLGYLSIGLVWTVIWLFAVALLVGSVGYLAFDDPESLLRGDDRPPVGQLVVLLVSALFLACVIGPGGWHVLTASWPLAVLSFVYAVRSLRPSYAREKLSFTAYGARGSTFGPPTAGDIALSLQPVRPGPFTDRVMRFYLAGWGWNGRLLLAMLPAGLAWSTAIGALMSGLSDAVHLVFGIVTVVLLVVSCVLGVRAFRAGPPRRGDQDEQAGGVTDLSADERAQRLEELKKRRAKRLRDR